MDAVDGDNSHHSAVHGLFRMRRVVVQSHSYMEDMASMTRKKEISEKTLELNVCAEMLRCLRAQPDCRQALWVGLGRVHTT